MQVIFTPRAEGQLDALHRYITDHGSERWADGYIARIVDFCTGLATFPLRGQARDDLLEGLRTTGFERRVTIAFVVTDDAVLIEGVFYGGQTSRRYSWATRETSSLRRKPHPAGAGDADDKRRAVAAVAPRQQSRATRERVPDRRGGYTQKAHVGM